MFMAIINVTLTLTSYTALKSLVVTEFRCQTAVCVYIGVIAYESFSAF